MHELAFSGNAWYAQDCRRARVIVFSRDNLYQNKVADLFIAAGFRVQILQPKQRY